MSGQFIETKYDGIDVTRPAGRKDLASKHMYFEGDRRALFLRFESARLTRNSYSVFKFVDEHDNVFLCFSNHIKFNDNPIEPGNCYILNATIKRHSHNSYENVDETHINRIKVLKCLGRKDK